VAFSSMFLKRKTCFSSVKNHNVSGPHLFPSFTTRQKNPFATPRTVLQRAKKALCNRSQFRTLFLPHRFIKIRPSHQRPVSIEFLTICRIPEFPISEQNRKSCGNVRICRKRAAVRRKNHSNLNKSFGMNIVFAAGRAYALVYFFAYFCCPISLIHTCVSQVFLNICMRGYEAESRVFFRLSMSGACC